MWFSELEQSRPGVVDSYEILSDILEMALEKDATRVDLEEFLGWRYRYVVISYESKCYVDFRYYLILYDALWGYEA